MTPVCSSSCLEVPFIEGYEQKWKFVLRQQPAAVIPYKRISTLFEPRHDKTNKMAVPPAKTQISLGIRPV